MIITAAEPKVIPGTPAIPAVPAVDDIVYSTYVVDSASIFIGEKNSSITYFISWCDDAGEKIEGIGQEMYERTVSTSAITSSVDQLITILKTSA
ncbi:hypothetical protein [uncultured Paraglaciecola sp.]|uniref:hypothetical protein n=1 Tax=uncultured Paraglaciecola sp. TaxID=1765024 RepID=UPI002626F5FE|nr:hypothetical protein [uncultured Paraglaciecola sp.]